MKFFTLNMHLKSFNVIMFILIASYSKKGIIDIQKNIWKKNPEITIRLYPLVKKMYTT